MDLDPTKITEIQKCAEKNKSPGPNRVTYEYLRSIQKHDPEILTKSIERAINERSYPG
jgi:hypothetical protein